MRAEWPLVGRAAELDFARRALATASLSGLVLAGRPGVGRTRMLHEVLAAAAGSGAAVVEVRAHAQAASIPFGALAHLLPDLEPDAGALRSAAKALVARAGGKRLVLGVDDAAHLDSATASLLYHLCQTRQAFVVVTVQVGATVADPVFALWKDGLAERLDLAELDRPRSDELVGALLGGHVDGAVLQELWELALGTPLFLAELVRAGTDTGRLTCVEDVWRASGPLAAGQRLLDLVDARIGALTEDEGTLLELLAHGAPLGSEVLLEMGAERVLARAERRGLISSVLDGKRLDVDLVHPLYAEVVRRRTTPLRLRRTHRILVGAIEKTGARRASDLPRLVGWRLAGGQPVEAAQLRRAAELAAATDYRTAERLARAAAEADPLARLLLGEILLATGRATEAAAVLAAAEAGPADAMRLALARATTLHWALGDPAAAAAVLAAVEGDEPAAVHAALALEAGRGTEALTALGEIVDRAGVAEPVLVRALAVQALALCAAGRYEDALAAAERGLALATTPADAWSALVLASARCGAQALAGRLDEAEELARAGYVGALARHWPVATAVYAGWLGAVALLRGQVRTARRWLREAMTAAPVPVPSVLGVREELTICVGLTGEALAAEALLPELDAVPSGSPWTVLSRSWLAAARGESTLAERLVLQAADLARAAGLHHAELVALHDAVRLGAAAAVGERLGALAGSVQGELAAARIAHAVAAAGGDAAALDAVAERFGALGTRLLAAEAAAQAVRVYEAAGRTGSGQSAGKRANAWAQDCEEVRTPALLQLKAPAELTRRELEIARLAASGMSSKAIAATLVVSVRTVDNVLHSVYAKLGVAGRSELAGSVG